MSTYNNIEAPTQWMEKPPSRSNRSKWIVSVFSVNCAEPA